jgi:hypothetical protein
MSLSPQEERITWPLCIVCCIAALILLIWF